MMIKQRGFTLVELMVVIAIIAVFSVLLISFSGAPEGVSIELLERSAP